MARFITDAGSEVILTDTQTGEAITIGRYGVWDDAGRRKPEVIGTGDDLDQLQVEFGPSLEVYDLKGSDSIATG
jgi:hypothetical protein